MTRSRPRIARTAAELAKALGASPCTARRWRRRGCPQLADGTFDISAVEAWHADYVSRSHDTSLGSATNGHAPAAIDPLREVRAARERVRVQLDELALAKMKGELIEREQVVDLLVERARTFKRAMRSVGRRLAHKLAPVSEPREVQKVIEREHDQILRDAYGDG